MSHSSSSFQCDQLNIEERISLVTAIWDSIAEEPYQPLLTEDHRLELQRRLTDHAANPDDTIPWEVVKADALARYPR